MEKEKWKMRNCLWLNVKKLDDPVMHGGKKQAMEINGWL